MTRLHRALRRLDEDLRALGREWALVGGLAVSARAEPRTTRDVDVVLAVEGDAEDNAALQGERRVVRLPQEMTEMSASVD